MMESMGPLSPDPLPNATHLFVKSLRKVSWGSCWKSATGLLDSPQHLMLIAFPSTHLVEQSLQAGRKRRLRPDILLKSFTHGIADVTAGLVIDLIWIVLDLAHCHGISFGEFHLAWSSQFSS
ncbi:hypothetical protein [Bradyrhizobium septentrionale]|uniref:Uncharacterized protein n=1 Tax=Bradyrhizobium septentrionale TaxID=1404411 RepID=A0A974A0D0_9BRAD|nr:hypothetical protein [Bradyrhizobium septentrionale]UGY20874.1 hypothetical protein HAP48_0036090 [Bradyrhizobium septentrionale]UGY29918.1 hypothetical protein HU675_0031585 [Bradyrhizobium septentrionale]